MHPSILALSTEVPPFGFSQNEAAEKMITLLSVDREKSLGIRKLYESSAIKWRYSVLPDFQKDRAEWDFWGKNYPEEIPGMAKRNAIYKREAPLLAQKTAEKALTNWGGDPSKITHVISVSCTGVMSPGIEFELIKSLKLKPSAYRLGINLMGCFGAFKGLAVANSFAKENPENRVLLVCTELCSLHLQTVPSLDNILGGALFSDGCAAAIIGMPNAQEKPLYSIQGLYSYALEDTLDKMTWEAGDHGFLMKLSPKVPALIGRHIQSFLPPLLGSLSSEDCDWAIHPGGKSILQAVEKAIKLVKDQTQASWNTLANYGNMSSATFLFVLEDLYKQHTRKKWSVGVGFGPGLSMEGILLHKP